MKKVMFISSTGGHLNELLQLKKIFKNYDSYLVTEKTKTTKDLKKDYDVSYLMYGTKHRPLRYIFVAIINIFKSIYLYHKIKPDVIVTTGAHTCVPICYIARLHHKKIIYIETFANIHTKTLTGRLIYPIATTFVVQWDKMLELYPKAVCWGWIF